MRKEDEVEIPSLTLDDDELKDHSPSTSQASPNAKRRLTPAPTQKTSNSNVKRSSNKGVYFILLLIVAMSAASSYWLWAENKKLETTLLDMQTQLKTVNTQVSEVDATADERDTNVAQTLENHDSEIRKLWGVANDRNRKAIADQSESLKTLQQKVSQLRESLSTQSKLVAVQGDAFNEVENGYNRLVDTVTQVESSQEAQSQTLKTMQQRVAQLGDTQKDSVDYQQEQLQRVSKQVNSLAGKVDSLGAQTRALTLELETISSQPTNLPDNLARRLQSTEEAIQSIDQFRPQVLREINSIKSQIRQISRQ